jgi:hypothetical protein
MIFLEVRWRRFLCRIIGIAAFVGRTEPLAGNEKFFLANYSRRL